MSKASYIQAVGSMHRQQGVSLLVVLILLVVMSLLGIAVLRSSGMQERMSANLRDRNDALQAAETGLVRAQADVIRGTYNALWNGSKTFAQLRTAASTTCSGNGVCDRSDPTNAATWESSPSKPTSWTYMVSGDTNTPQYGYVIEYLGKARGESAEVQGVCNTSSAPRYICERPMFRVTSYGRGRGVAQAVLQANILSQPL
jgi:type IV pilus assembly protein PilX